MNFFGLALRNVLRNRRRTALNAIAIAIGVAIMMVCLGWVQGYSTYIFKAVISFQTGAAQILPEGYQEASARFPLDIALPDYATSRDRILQLSGVTGAGGRIDFFARLIAPKGSVRLLGQGIDSAAEKNVTVLSRMIQKGAYLDGGPGVLIGEGIAEKLGLAPGGTVLVSATDRDGVENRLAMPVKGLFSFGYGAMDDGLFFMDLASAQDLLDMYGDVTRIVLAGPDPAVVEKDAALAASILNQARTAARGLGNEASYPPAKAYGWKDFAKATISAVATDSDSFYVMAVVLFGLIVIGILNSMSMSVNERHREIATLRAIGFKGRDVRRLVLLESVALASIGTLAGLVLALPFVIWLGVYGLDLSKFIPKDFPVPFGELFRSDYRLWHLVLSIGMGVGSCVLGAMRPAKQAAKLPIAQTIGAGL